MYVRKMSTTTISLIVLAVGLYFLIPVIYNALPYEMRYILNRQLDPSPYYIEKYHSVIISAAFWSVVIAGIIDSVVRSRVALELFSSFAVPFILIIPIIIIAIMPSVNVYMFWGLLYVIMIWGVYRTFRMLIGNYRPARQKLVHFIRTINSNQRSVNSHAADLYLAVGTSLSLLGVGALLFFSLVVYAVVHWRSFF